MYRFVLAWHFLTVLPLSQRHHEPCEQDFARSMRWYPTVGLLLGGLLVLADYGLSTLFSSSVVSMLLIVLLVLLTGGLHQDGLADTVDGLAGGKTPEQRLIIMRDSRIGAFGATALILDLGLRYVTFESLPPDGRWAILLSMPIVGRWIMVVAAKSAPYARGEGGIARPFLSHLTGRDVGWATVLPILALPFLLGGYGLLGLAVIALLAWVFTRFTTYLCGGVTGDILGATNEGAEIMWLMMAPALLMFS